MKSFRSILKDLLRQSKLNRINLLEKLLKLEKKKKFDPQLFLKNRRLYI